MVASFENSSKNPFAGRYTTVSKVVAETQPPTTVRDTIYWLLNDLGISPVPNCPFKAVEFGKPPKAPNYIGFDGCVIGVSWKEWQDKRPPKPLLDRWFNKKHLQHTGVGAIAGLNHKGHYISFIDIDAKHFDDQEQCDQAVEEWRENFPILNECPRFRSPGGGYRFLIALSQKDENFSKVAAFNFKPHQETSIGEILHNNGGHSLFPPSVREDGKPYYWEHWASYPPVIDSYKSVGLYTTLKAKDKKTGSPALKIANTANTANTVNNNSGTYDDKFNQLIADINSKLTIEQAFNWEGHDFISDGNKVRGKCPWHDSNSGTSFYCERDKKGNLVYRCAGCDDGGNIFGYRYSLKCGQIGLQPKGKDFIDILKELGSEIGSDVSFLDKPKKQKNSKNETLNFTAIDDDPAVSPIQIAEAFLFCDGRMFEGGVDAAQTPKKIIVFEDNFYKWEGNYYEFIPMKTIRRVVSNYWNSVAVEDEKGNIKYPFTSELWVSRLVKWVIDRKSVDQSELPKGINFKNGVVTLDWSKGIPVPVFESHNPDKHYFFKQPKVLYDPQADPSDCNRMLTCLDDDQRDIVLKVMSASLDLTETRKRIGARKIKILFLIGEGNNGKDTLRNTLTTILGNDFFTGVSLQNFINHDSGASRFGLAPLIRSKVNWPSETVKNTTSVDDSASLKSFATGDPLYSEFKGKDAVPYNPEGICIFNTNHNPNLTGTTQAAKDRFIPIEFKKIYQTGADYDPAIHALGDIRFKDDPDFLANNVCPAFFNRLIKSLQDLVTNGIDYSCTQNALRKIQLENNHLFEFIDDANLVVGAGEIKLEEVFTRLEEFYKEQGILSIDDFKNRRWADPIKPSDPYLKGVNQLFPKLKRIFPKIEKLTLTDKVTRRKTTFIKGLVWGSVKQFTTLEGKQQNLNIRIRDGSDPLVRTDHELTTNSLRNSDDNLEPLLDKDLKPTKPTKPTFSKFLKFSENTQLDFPQETISRDSQKYYIDGEKTGFRGFRGSESAPSKDSENPLKHDVGFGNGETGFRQVDSCQNHNEETQECDRTAPSVVDQIFRQIDFVDPVAAKREKFNQEQKHQNNEILSQANLAKEYIANRKYKSAFDILADGRVKAAVVAMLRQPENSHLYEEYLGQLECFDELGEVWDE